MRGVIMLGYISNRYFIFFACSAFFAASCFFAGVKYGKKTELQKVVAVQNEEKSRLLESIKKNIADNAALNQKIIIEQKKYYNETANLTQRLNDEIKKNNSNYTCRINANILQLRKESRDRANLFAAPLSSNAALPANTGSQR